MGKRVYQDQLLERLDPRGMPYYWFGGPPPTGLAEPGTDFHAVVNGRVAITPIQLDLTARRLLERIRTWDWRRPWRPEDAALSDRCQPVAAGIAAAASADGHAAHGRAGP